ncbi:MAG: hypothetical protein U0796_03840 [Gemmatales bacterium]
MYPHRINLREPWQTRPDDPHTFARVFRWPAELLPHEEVWLVVGTVYAPFSVIVNEQQLGIQPTARLPLELNITSVLRNQNLLEIACLAPLAPTEEFKRVEHVYLEVRRTVHLQQLTGTTVWQAGHPSLQLSAQVTGQPERNLSVVVLLDHQEVHYQELGKPIGAIRATTPPLKVQPWLAGQANALHTLEVQLLDPASILAQHEFHTGFLEPGTTGERLDFPALESIHESTWLAEADRVGRLVKLPEIPGMMPYVWHHPCLV